MSSSRQVQVASQVLRQYLGEYKSLLQSAPSILITSSAPQVSSEWRRPSPGQAKAAPRPKQRDTNSERFHSNLTKHTEKVQFTLCLENQLRTVSFSYAAAYPTVSDLRAALDLMSRSGCRSIVAVGSGAAMDLAKAVKAVRPSSNIIMIPRTLGAVLSSAADESLIFCPKEDSLLPLHQASDTPLEHNEPSSIKGLRTVLIDPEAIVVHNATHYVTSTPKDPTIASIYEAAFTTLVIALDAALRHSPNHMNETNTNIDACVQYTMACLQKLQRLESHRSQQEDPDPASCFAHLKQDMIQACIHAGPLLQFGNTRSMPYTISWALLPQFFPHCTWLSFVSSLLPGILTLPSNKIHSYNTMHYQQLVQDIELQLMPDVWARHGRPLASFAEGTPSYEALLDKIDAQGALLGDDGHDLDSTILQHVLIQSLNK